MKPDFALSLSFEGICLLHRVAGGWQVLGEASVSSATLADDLQRLCAKAQALVSGKVYSKLVIPNGQIKYMRIATAGLGPARRDAAARAALDGATPYAVTDLVYDTVQEGDDTHIAAVARETLLEAETFAEEHGFGPVSFVATPPPGSYPAEPFFGAARAADEVGRIVPDEAPIRILDPEAPSAVTQFPRRSAREAVEALSKASRPIDLTAQQVSEAPEAAALSSNATTAVPVAVPSAEPPQPPAGRAKKASSVRIIRRAAETAPEAEAPGAKRSAPPPRPVSLRPVPSPAAPPEPQSKADAQGTPPPAPGRAVSAAPSPEPEVKPGFSSRRSRRESLKERLAQVSKLTRPEPITPPASAITAPSIDISAPKTSAPDRPARPPLPPRREPLEPARAATASPPPPRRAAVTPPTDRPLPESPPPVSPVAVPTAVRRDPPSDAGAPPVAKPVPLPKTAQAAAANGLAQRMAESVAAEPTEADRMAVFGTRSSQRQVGGKPRFFGLILTTLLLLLLLGVAAWATGYVEEGLARLFGTREPVIASAPVEDGSELDLPRGAQEVPSPQAARLLPAPQVAQPLPNVTPAPSVVPRTPPLPRPSAGAPETSAAPRAPAPTSGTFDGTRTSDEARYAVTGIWPRAPRKPSAPPMISIDDVYIASVDPNISGQDALALPDPGPSRRDVSLGHVPSPAPFETVFRRDARGLTIPVPEGALDPGGFTVVLGRPPIEPPPAPGRQQTTAAATLDPPAAAGGPAPTPFARLRPRSRPAGIAETLERASLGGLTRAELAEARPRLRPAQLARALPEGAQASLAALDPDRAGPDAADVDADADAPPPEEGSVGAMTASLVPVVRPKNLARPSAGLPATDGSTASAPAAVAPRTVTPRLPSSASVARQATVKNAIKLNRVNLIGVYGTAANRRALVRMANGRYRKVKVGDRLDGGHISAIGENNLRYQKGGRNLTLNVPSG